MRIRKGREEVKAGCEEERTSYSQVSEGSAVKRSSAEPAIADDEGSNQSSTEQDED